MSFEVHTRLIITRTWRRVLSFLKALQEIAALGLNQDLPVTLPVTWCYSCRVPETTGDRKL